MGRAQSPVYRVLAPLLSPLSPPRKLSVVLLFMDIHFFLRLYLFIFRQKDREGEREGEKHQCVVAPCTLPTGDLAHNPGMCPDWESNWHPFGSQAGAQSTEPHQLGLFLYVMLLRP